MYEDGIDVVYDVTVGRHDGDEVGWWSEHRRVTLPGWCAGDVPMALALYTFGNRDAVDDVRVVDWQPR